MEIYIIKNRFKIKPFLEEASNLLIADKKISDLQKEVFSVLKLSYKTINDISEITDEGEHIVVGENVYFTSKLLEEFILLSREKKTNTVCAVAKGIFTTRTVINVQDVKDCGDYVCYNLFYYTSKNNRKNVEQIIFNLDKNHQYLLFPNHMCDGEKYFIPFDEKSIIQIDHWANLWSANLVYILSHLSHLEKNKIKLLLNAVKSLSFNKWRVLSKMNKIGNNCDIHHKSYIECSIIGKNVTIGAGTVIRESIIGDDVFIGNGVIIESSVIGKKSVILNGHILQSVLYPETFSVTHFISASIIGKRTFIGSGAVLTDFRFDKKFITLIKENIKLDSGNIFLGCCLGNDVYLGGGCVVAPGREIPNNTKISLSKDRIITGSSGNKEIESFRTTC